MEDKIEVGEYVRLHYGKIDRVKNNDYYMQQYIECEKGLYLRENIVKHSKNIIDLIEEGDYVNGDKVYKITNALIYLRGKSPCHKSINDIESIVTKEQFSSIEYKI